MRPTCADCLYFRPTSETPDVTGLCDNRAVRTEISKVANGPDMSHRFEVAVAPNFGCVLHSLRTDDTE